ncbi:hypothetical protein Tco_1031331 [Tanacetum coccineum]|uniref:Gag-Pol polyprotein n=1 Tax=Tanacetum coccineum TaxID=301880 RepID=A0ABQ5GA77_9ASTR
MIASSESRNSSKNMPRYSSNDMVHNHYLDEARKKIQVRDRNSKTSMMPSARFQNTTNGSKLKPRSTNHSTRSLRVSKGSCIMIEVVPIADHSKNSNSFSDSKQFVCSTCHKCVFNANHDACITKLLKEVNSRAKTQFLKTKNSNKPVDQKSHTQKPGRQIFIAHRFSPNKTSIVYEKNSQRFDLRWKPTGRIFKYVGLKWIPTGKLLASCTSKDNSKPLPKASTSINVQMEKHLDLSAVDHKMIDTVNDVEHISFKLDPKCQDERIDHTRSTSNTNVRIAENRRQLETNGEMCMFALTVSQTKPKNIKEAMADSAWIESMQEELHQFDRLDDRTSKSCIESEYVSLTACCTPSSTVENSVPNYGFHFDKIPMYVTQATIAIRANHSNIPYQAHRCPITLHTGTGFKYLVRHSYENFDIQLNGGSGNKSA